MVGLLAGRVALVAGASKNIGKGIALELAANGAITYLTARSVDDVPGRFASLTRTALAIERAGGTAIPMKCDHRDDAQVEAVFERIRRDHGRIDLVVNVASPDFSDMVGVPFWELSLDHITACLELGPRSDYVTTALAARMMVPAGSGLVVNISSHGAQEYLLSTPYGVGKAAIDKLTQDAALELRAHGVAVVSLWPGFVLTEEMLSRVVLTEDGRRQIHGLDLDLDFGETPKFNGRAVVALATDRDILSKTGGSYWSSALAREYGFTEDDGKLPVDMTHTRILRDRGDDLPEFWRGVVRTVPNGS